MTDPRRDRASQNTIGAMVNPTSLPDAAFARECYRYLLAGERGEEIDDDWLDEPRLWPKQITREVDRKKLARTIADLRLTETAVYARAALGDESFVARFVYGRRWNELDWYKADGTRVEIRAAVDSVIGTVQTWRMFLDGFRTHPIAFMLDGEGRRATGDTVGLLESAPIQVLGITRTGRTSWATSEQAEVLVPDPEAWARTLDALDGSSGAELRAAGIAPRSRRAWSQGRPPVGRNAVAANKLAERRALAAAGLRQDPSAECVAPGCRKRLRGRQLVFCADHATYPGSRRKAWREAAAR